MVSADPSIPPAAAPAPPAPGRLRALLAALEEGLVERRPAVRLALLAALAGEHTLLVGPPGTAKSLLARRLHLAFAEGAYFERLLTRYTVPEELFGPLSIRALEEDRYERQTAGFLPQASIAFVDEVFKANSAILNALLTLLNEREFDNGPRREPCPLVSVIGATNAVPEDEVGEAFFDRFLVRIPVEPVSAAGFRTLLAAEERAPAHLAGAVREAEREALARAARGVDVGDEVAGLLAEARGRLAGEGLYVSDRRWVKITALLRVAAAAEGRARVAAWDLWLLPWCVAPDAERQARVSGWLSGRLGVRDALSPPRLTRAVQAFEAQLEAERMADDLDYDELGRLRLGADLAAEVGDAKGGGAAPRLSFTRRRRYGQTHVAARVGQLDDLDARIAGYLAELGVRQEALAGYRAGALWIDEDFAARAAGALASTVEALGLLRARARAAREGFLALPRLAADPGVAPEPVAHEPIET
jgi:MoxR-like ATPase